MNEISYGKEEKGYIIDEINSLFAGIQKEVLKRLILFELSEKTQQFKLFSSLVYNLEPQFIYISSISIDNFGLLTNEQYKWKGHTNHSPFEARLTICLRLNYYLSDT